MKTQLVTGLLFCLILISGCGQQNDSIQVTEKFWQAFNQSDQQGLEAVLKDPKDAEFLAKGKSTLMDYQVLDEVEGGVNVKFSRFCYPDVVVPTVLVDIGGQKKVDFRATFIAQMKAMKNTKTLKKYCYEFADKPLSGVINGQPWTFVKENVREVNWGDKVTHSTRLYSEDCDADIAGACQKPSLNISNLKLDSDGGNFSNTENLSIYLYPNDNIVISTGSYRITMLDDGSKKLELSFNKDQSNQLSGYFILN